MSSETSLRLNAEWPRAENRRRKNILSQRAPLAPSPSVACGRADVDVRSSRRRWLRWPRTRASPRSGRVHGGVQHRAVCCDCSRPLLALLGPREMSDLSLQWAKADTNQVAVTNRD